MSTSMTKCKFCLSRTCKIHCRTILSHIAGIPMVFVFLLALKFRLVSLACTTPACYGFFSQTRFRKFQPNPRCLICPHLLFYFLCCLWIFLYANFIFSSGDIISTRFSKTFPSLLCAYNSSKVSQMSQYSVFISFFCFLFFETNIGIISCHDLIFFILLETTFTCLFIFHFVLTCGYPSAAYYYCFAGTAPLHSNRKLRCLFSSLSPRFLEVQFLHVLRFSALL